MGDAGHTGLPDQEKRKEKMKEAEILLTPEEGQLTNEKKGVEEEFVPSDGGWGWIVCLASFWTNGTLFGTLNTFGILFVSILEEFKEEGSEDLAFKVCKCLIGSSNISWSFKKFSEVPFMFLILFYAFCNKQVGVFF